jgi:ABC-type multidrug transport system ATPase subunit
MKAEVAEGRTLLFATHYLEEADQAADRILVINKGRLLADGTPAELKKRQEPSGFPSGSASSMRHSCWDCLRW